MPRARFHKFKVGVFFGGGGEGGLKTTPLKSCSMPPRFAHGISDTYLQDLLESGR